MAERSAGETPLPQEPVTSQEPAMIRIYRGSIYGWRAKNSRAGRAGRWHAHAAFGRPLCSHSVRGRSTFGWLDREDRPPQAETCPDCWKLPDEGILISEEPRESET